MAVAWCPSSQCHRIIFSVSFILYCSKNLIWTYTWFCLTRLILFLIYHCFMYCCHEFVSLVSIYLMVVTQLLSRQHWKTVRSDLVIVCMLVGMAALQGPLALLSWVWQRKYKNKYTFKVKGEPNMECPHATMSGTALKTKLNTVCNVTQLKAICF